MRKNTKGARCFRGLRFFRAATLASSFIKNSRKVHATFTHKSLKLCYTRVRET
jgi:hypothetical protein